MPGKVNPVMSEMMMQVCAQVFGNDVAITWGGATGNFELNVMMPMMAHNLLESIQMLANATSAFQSKCVAGITANVSRCNELVERSLAMVTALAPIIGYDRAAEIARQSADSGKTIREICREKNLLPEEDLNKALDPVVMTQPGGNGEDGS
jgi:fumarate hydratase class II